MTIESCSRETCIRLCPILISTFFVSVVGILRDYSPRVLIFSKVTDLKSVFMLKTEPSQRCFSKDFVLINTNVSLVLKCSSINNII